MFYILINSFPNPATGKISKSSQKSQRHLHSTVSILTRTQGYLYVGVVMKVLTCGVWTFEYDAGLNKLGKWYLWSL